MTGGVHGTGWAVDHHDLVRGEAGEKPALSIWRDGR
jgi:hypothetical protein